MELTELRLQNLFYPINRRRKVHLPIETVFKVCSIGFKVEAIPCDKIPSQVAKWNKFNPNDMSPIPLTEKWLLDFGFISVAKSQWLSITLDEKDECYLYFNPFGKGIAIDQGGKECSYEIDLKYVHQLQNLYFALCGKELILK